MAFSYAYGAFNVEGTLNNWIGINLSGAGAPAWMPSARVLYDYPRTPLFSGYSGHAFTITHLGAPEPLQMFQGRHTVGGSAGQHMHNVMRVDCWVNRQQAGSDYAARLRQMGDMVTRLFTSGRTVELTNLYTGAQAPSGIGALIRLSPALGRTVAPDPNPDVERRSYDVPYSWLERV